MKGQLLLPIFLLFLHQGMLTAAEAPVASDQMPKPVVAETGSKADRVTSGESDNLLQASAVNNEAEQQLATAQNQYQDELPAGVCPVISEYLFEQCLENPQDESCR